MNTFLVIALCMSSFFLMQGAQQPPRIDIPSQSVVDVSTTREKSQVPGMKPPINLTERFQKTIAPYILQISEDEKKLLMSMFQFFSSYPQKDLTDFEQTLNPVQKLFFQTARITIPFQMILKNIAKDLHEVKETMMANTWALWLKKIQDGSFGSSLPADLQNLLTKYFSFKLQFPQFVSASVFEKVMGVDTAQAFNTALQNKEFGKIIHNSTADAIHRKDLGVVVMWRDYLERMNMQQKVPQTSIPEASELEDILE